jgi:hypothetical protein
MWRHANIGTLPTLLWDLAESLGDYGATAYAADQQLLVPVVSVGSGLELSPRRHRRVIAWAWQNLPIRGITSPRGT